MDKKSNVRYGVVNFVLREKYEKKYHLPYGYEYMTYDEQDAIDYCRRGDIENFVVEMIYDTHLASNLKEEIYRSGKENEEDS